MHAEILPFPEGIPFAMLLHKKMVIQCESLPAEFVVPEWMGRNLFPKAEWVTDW